MCSRTTRGRRYRSPPFISGPSPDPGMGRIEKSTAMLFAAIFLFLLMITDGQRIAIRRKLPKKTRTTPKPSRSFLTSPGYDDLTFGPYGVLPTGAPDTRCSPPDVFVNGSLVDHDFDDDVREIQFEGQVGPDPQTTPCKIRCINGAWVGPICTNAGKTVKKDEILRRCTVRITDTELVGRVERRPLPPDTEVSVPHGSELRLRCTEPGLYKFVGNGSLLCDDGEWTADMPYCVATTLHRNFSMQAPPTILYHVVSGDAGLDEDGQIVVFPGTILNIDCIYQSKFGNPQWSWSSSHSFAPFRQYPSAWAIPADEKTWKYRLSIYYAKEYDSGTYICTTPQDISNEITLVVKEVHCPGISSVDHSRVMSIDGSRMHSRARFACLEGFEINGPDQITCLPSGQWSEEAPHCKVLKCPPLMTENTHLIVSTRNRTFGTRVVFSCPTGFELAGPPFLNCLAGGNWSDATPTCRPIRCPPPVAPINGRVVDTGRHLAGDFVQYTCNAGHVVVGEPVAVCTDHGVWSHPTPTCKAACEFPGEPSNGHVIPTKFHYGIGEVVVVGCQPGYRVLGYQRLRCTGSGHWSTPLPHCRPYLSQQT